MNVSAWALKYAGKPIPRSARSGLSGQTKAPDQKSPERAAIKNRKIKAEKSPKIRKSLKRGLKCKIN